MSMPSGAGSGPTFFDRFATATNQFVSKAWFFLACVLLVLIWLPTFLAVKNIDTWQLLINTPTTVITFLLVALQSNTSKRADTALQTKLNALAEGMADLLESRWKTADKAAELRQAVGLEDKEST
jgi:low affinity Fe/Cu permease